jgi:hypothetical protein
MAERVGWTRFEPQPDPKLQQAIDRILQRIPDEGR